MISDGVVPLSEEGGVGEAVVVDAVKQRDCTALAADLARGSQTGALHVGWSA